MSGQFEQRRLARPSYQLEVLDRFCGEEQLAPPGRARAAWRELLAARRRHEELTRGAALAEARLAELRALVEDTEGLEPGDEERLRDERERLRHVADLAEARPRPPRRSRPRRATAPQGSSRLAERAVAPLERLAPELAAGGRRAARRRAAPARDGVRPPRLPRLARGGAGPPRADRGGARPDRRGEAPLPRRDLRRAARARATEARAELAALDDGRRSRRGGRSGARARRRRASTSSRSSCGPSGTRRRRRSPTPSRPSSHDVGMGEGEFVVRAARAGRPARPAPTRRSSSSARTPACRSARSPRPPRAASSRASRSRSRPSPAATRSSSTRSTPASAARPPTPSAGC